MTRVIRALDRLHGALGRLVSLLEAMRGVAACEHPRDCSPDNLCPSCFYEVAPSCPGCHRPDFDGQCSWCWHGCFDDEVQPR